jgi:hypothetical protein
MSAKKKHETIVLMDYAAIAAKTGLDANRLRLYASRGKMPEPDYKVSQSPGWLPETIDAWMATFTDGKVPARKRTLQA